MRNKALLAVVLFFIFYSLSAQDFDHVGPGRAIYFDGIDDYIDLGDIYDDMTLPYTVSAWIYPEPNLTSQSPVFVSQDGSALYQGFWLVVNGSHAFTGYGDGVGENNPAFRRDKSAPLPNPRTRWLHVTAVVRGADDMSVYINGHDAGGSYVGNSTRPMASDFPGDIAQIGYWRTNDVSHYFKGYIDEVRVYNKALAPEEIRNDMCRALTGLEPGLIGYWNFDEVTGVAVLDGSPNHFDGELIGNPARVYSGAPIGDESINSYPGSWSGEEIAFGDLLVRNIMGDPWGAHVYAVNQSPSRTSGLETADGLSPYYGIFLADNFPGKTFDIKGCVIFERLDNSVDFWTRSSVLTGKADRLEVVLNSGTGPSFDLGEDTTLCLTEPVILSPFADPSGFEFTWHDGSRQSSYVVSDYGKFWVKVEDACGIAYDTVEFLPESHSPYPIPNIITPNETDNLNHYFYVAPELTSLPRLEIFNRWGKSVYYAQHYKNDWSGDGLSSGVYFYILSGPCIQSKKGTIHVVR